MSGSYFMPPKPRHQCDSLSYRQAPSSSSALVKKIFLVIVVKSSSGPQGHRSEIENEKILLKNHVNLLLFCLGCLVKGKQVQMYSAMCTRVL